MKNKTLKFIGVIVITTFILSYLSSTALVSAAEENGFILETSDTKNIGMGVLQTERPVASTLQMTGDVSGGFSYLDFLGNVLEGEESVLETENSELYYPVNLRYENFWNQENLKEFRTYYARARNVSDELGQYGNYSTSLKTEQYELSVDSSCEISVSDLTSEILFNAKSKGVYQIWLNNINLIGSVVIFSPSDKRVTPISDELPDVIPGSASLGKYFYFAAYETGTYRIYMETSDPIIKLRADYHKPQSLKFGEAVHGGKDPSDPTFFDTVYSMDVYQIDINDLETVNKYLLDFEYGTPVRNYFVEDSYQVYSLNLPSGINRILPTITEGKIYIVIDNPDYFYWNWADMPQADPLKYTMKFEEIEPSEHIVGNNETINLLKSIGVTARTFEIENVSVGAFHFEDLGANSPNVIQSGGSYVQKIDEDEARYASIPSTVSSSNGTFSTVILEPGKYRVIFQHSGSMGPEYLHFASKIVELKNISVEGMDLSGTLPYNFTTLNFEDVLFSMWEEYPNTYGATYPVGFDFPIDENFWDYGYNVSIHSDKNSDLFDDYITPDLAVLFDDSVNTFTDYTDAIQPGNATKVPVTNGGTGDALIIGSYDKFDRIEVILADPSISDDLIWEFYDDTSGWTTFDSEDPNFADGTRTGTGSLTKSGTVSWDPEELSDWEFVTLSSDNGGAELPDTNDQDYYLIRVVTNGSSASIANITSVNLRKFVRINFDAVSRLAFNIGTQEEPIYYRTTSQTANNLKFASSYGETSYRDTAHTIDRNYYSEHAILYVYAKDIQLYDYNGSNNGVYVPLNKPLNFSVCVFQPEANYKHVIDYNISTMVPTTHSNQLNMSTLTNFTESEIIIPDELILLINMTPQTLYDWTQINVQFFDAEVISTRLVLPAMYDIKAAATYTGTYGNGEFNLGLAGVNMSESIEFGFITETIYLEFVIENTTNNAATLKIWGGQFNYPGLIILEASSTTNWGLIGGIGGGVVVLIGVSLIIYKKKNPV